MRAATLEDAIGAAWSHVTESRLGGHSTLMVALSLDKRETWINGIFENSRHARFSFNPETGALECFQLWSSKAPKFRKCRAASELEAAEKINAWAESARAEGSR